MCLVYSMHACTCTWMGACYSTTSAWIPLAMDPNNTYKDMHSLIVWSWKCVTSMLPMNVCWCNSFDVRNFASINTWSDILIAVMKCATSLNYDGCNICPFPCCSGCPTNGLIGTTAHPRSSQGHLVCSNWPVWSDQPTVHHSVWKDHFQFHYTPQHTFLLTIRHHIPGSGAGVLCKASRSYTEWKWYLQQLGVSDYLWRWGECHCMSYSE